MIPITYNMKRLVLIFVYALLVFPSPNGRAQDRDVSASEASEAKSLAVAFFSRLDKGDDVESLVKDYFVRDFVERLAYCRKDTSEENECRGEGKDFWATNLQLTALKGSSEDHFRDYSQAINYLWFSSRTLEWAYLIQGKKVTNLHEDPDKDIEKSVMEKLKAALKVDPSDILKLGFLGYLEGEQPNVNSVTEYRRRQAKYDELIAAWRNIEKDFRAEFSKKKPEIRQSFKPSDFWVGDEKNSGRFFNYPKGTRMIEVWWNDDISVPFKIDMILENGRLKIVAVYPPID